MFERTLGEMNAVFRPEPLGFSLKTSTQYPCGRALGFRTITDVSLKVREALKARN